MGGKSSQSTQQVSVPPSVLAQYNNVNSLANQTAATPFQQYSTSPSAFVAPLNSTQLAGIANTNTAAGQAQPYYQCATNMLEGAQAATSPYYGGATGSLMGAAQTGAGLAGASLGSLAGAAGSAQPLQCAAGQNFGTAYNNAQPALEAANQNVGGAQAVGAGLAGASLGSLAGGSAAAAPLQGASAQGLGSAYAGAQPYNQAATGLAAAGAGAVCAQQIGGQQIGQFMSPYIQSVLQGTEGILNQQNQQAQSGQLGNAIQQGAFGGCRAGIAAANLSQQQQLANSKIYSCILNQGYSQALGAAQQQQGVNLGAGQANRTAIKCAASQLQSIGQQGYSQGTGTAQAQGALGQQLYGQGATTAAQQAALGQQQYGQGLGAAQEQAALGQQGYTQGMGLGSAQQGLASQEYGQGLSTSQQLAALGQQQYGQGATTSQQLAGLGQDIYGTGAATSQGLASLGSGAQTAALQGATAQQAAGATAQQTCQAGLTALYNQFLQQQSYPFQVDQFLANIAEGTGALSGSTTTTTTPGGLFSDERLKTDIRKIGKTFDGQAIYSFRYKGDPHNLTRMGLMAQEVEGKHPEAVGLAGGYRTVDYKEATDKAADRGHFARGGFAAANENGYAGGGTPTLPGITPTDLAQILQSQAQMYAPFSQTGGLYGGAQNGSPRGGSSYVPQANLPVAHLAVAGGLAPQKTAAQQINDYASAGKSIQGGLNSIQKYMPSQNCGSAGPNDTPFSQNVGCCVSGGLGAPMARGGLAKAKRYACGGMPYGDGLDIPDCKPDNKLAVAGGLPGTGQSTIGQITDLASTAAKLAAMFKRGGATGRGHYDDGGCVPNVPSNYACTGASPDQNINWGCAPTQSVKLPNFGAPKLSAEQMRQDAALDKILSDQRSLTHPAPAVSSDGSDLPPIQYTVRGQSPSHGIGLASGRRGGSGVSGGGCGPSCFPNPNETPFNSNVGPIDNNPGGLDGGMAAALEGRGNTSGAPINGMPSASPVSQGLGSVTVPPGQPSSLTPPATADTDVQGIGDKLGSGVEQGLKAAGKWIAPQGGFLDQLGQGKTGAVVPFLTGLAAMTGAPTRNPFVAITQGLGAGAQSYMGTQKQQAEIAQTQAETGNIGAHTSQVQTVTMDELTKLAKSGLVAQPDPNGKLVTPDGKHWSLVKSGTLLTGQGDAAQPAYHYLGQNGQAVSKQAVSDYLTAPEADQLHSRDQMNAVQTDASAARAALTKQNQNVNAQSFNDAGLLQPGPYNPVKTALVGKWNDAVRTAGHPEWQIDDTGLAASAVADKMSIAQAQAKAVGADERSLGALTANMKATANQTMPRDAALEILSSDVVDNQRKIDRANYYGELNDAVKNNGGLDSSFLARDAEQSFGNDHTADQYNKEAVMLKNAMSSGSWQKINGILQGGDAQKKAALISALDSKSPNFHRYFTGGN